MFIKTFVECREMETDRVLHAAYDPGPDLQAILLDDDDEPRLPDEVGSIAVEGALEDSRTITYAGPLVALNPLIGYRSAIGMLLMMAGYDVWPFSEDNAMSEDERTENLEEFRGPLQAQRYWQGERDGHAWAKEHAKIHGLIRLAELRADAGNDWETRFEQSDGTTLVPRLFLASTLLGTWDSMDDLEVRREAWEVFDERGRDSAYLHGFANGALALRDDDGEEQPTQLFPDTSVFSYSSPEDQESGSELSDVGDAVEHAIG